MQNPELPGSFAALGVAPDLVTALESQGITEPFPIQALTIADALAGRDVCGKAKTGSGKTLAFGVPVLQRLGDPRPPLASTGPRPPRGLVLVPTRELARQVAEVLLPLAEKTGLELTACYGGAGMDAQIRSLAEGTDVVVATPGRLIDLRQRGDVDLEPDRGAWSSTKPTAWRTWALCPRLSGCCARSRSTPDHALLGHPRRRR